jgi:hypothetical protein
VQGGEQRSNLRSEHTRWFLEAISKTLLTRKRPLNMIGEIFTFYVFGFTWNDSKPLAIVELYGMTMLSKCQILKTSQGTYKFFNIFPCSKIPQMFINSSFKWQIFAKCSISKFSWVFLFFRGLKFSFLSWTKGSHSKILKTPDTFLKLPITPENSYTVKNKNFKVLIRE